VSVLSGDLNSSGSYCRVVGRNWRALCSTDYTGPVKLHAPAVQLVIGQPQYGSPAWPCHHV